MRTGRTDRRVPATDTSDALGELSALVNAMLDRIHAVVAGMRGALDNVAHDLRTPMARLRATAESALNSTDPATLREALADCLEESDRVIAMLNTLMDISEAETGTMALRREPTNLADLVQQSVDLYEDLAEQRGLTIESASDDELIIGVDRNRMRQVVANLLDNAVKYTPPGGAIRIEARRDGPDAVLSVSDTGAGHPRGRVAAYLGPPLPRRQEPVRTRARPWIEPGQGNCRSPRWTGGGHVNSRERKPVRLDASVCPDGWRGRGGASEHFSGVMRRT